jgi:hypothetical protein
MSERTAFVFVFAAAAVIPLSVLLVLSMLGASSRLIALAYFLLLCVAADQGVRVILRYRR